MSSGSFGADEAASATLHVDEFVRSAGDEPFLDVPERQGNDRAAPVWTDEEWQAWNRGTWSWGWYGRYGSYYGYDRDQGGHDAAVASASESQQGETVPLPADRGRSGEWQDHGPSSGGGARWSDWGGGGRHHDGWWGPSQKADYSDPPTFPGWTHYRLWRRSVLRWDSHTDVLLHRRAERILKGMEWDLQLKLDHIDESTLTSKGYINAILEVMDVISGEKEDSEKRRAIKAALYEGGKRQDETLAQYSLRRQAQFTTASRFIELPDDVKAFMLEEQAGLTKQGVQNLRTITGGRTSYEAVRKALQVLDVEGESITRPGKTSYFHDEGVVAEEQDSENFDIDVENVFMAIEELQIDEDEATSFLESWNAHPPRRTWAQNKILKAARRKDRRHFDDASSRPARPNNHRNLSREELKKITKCKNCGLVGHWREDCTAPSRKNGEKSKDFSAFTFLRSSFTSSSGISFIALLGVGSEKDGTDPSFMTLLALPPGHAIIDPGASQDLIGLKAYEALERRLQEVGLKPIKLSERPQAASGVGGEAKPLFSSLVPIVLGKQPGVIKLTVLDQDIPQLLSIGLLEFTGSIVDINSNTITFCKFGSQSPIESAAHWTQIHWHFLLGRRAISSAGGFSCSIRLSSWCFQLQSVRSLRGLYGSCWVESSVEFNFLSLQKFFDIPIRIDNTSCCSKTDDFGNRCCFVGRDCTASCDVNEFETAWLAIEGALIRVAACDSLMSHDWSSQFSRIPSILGFFLCQNKRDLRIHDCPILFCSLP